MRGRRSGFDRIRSVLGEADTDEPVTAREILRQLAEHGEEFDSAHRIATVLGRRARQWDVEVIGARSYRCRLGETS